ncbi:hypothetical protein [Pseudoxanthomonas sp. PXM01]|uniref:hypothetical protein n=1 Tax=Pseudoxanthomonas sp. PXM01 TaxID=2769295 RepID=UPI00178267D2|nr:hypothetical protein [Pseudoxanthomonas sp. PXM01]MBD9469234.1 hypothetical protein [Pseudoxanthomonas sp. PXM01]
MTSTSALHAGLQHALPELARTFRDPWWIIGSAAMALAGVPDIAPHDIDVLCSREDALRLQGVWASHIDRWYRPQDEARFRSTFARFTHLPMPLEAMGGLEVMTSDGWHPLRVLDDMALEIEGHAGRVPTLAEQHRIFLLFGRTKDLAKAARIAAFLEHSHVA